MVKKKDKLSKRILSKLSEKAVAKKILKPSKTTLTLEEYIPEPYVSRYFKDEIKPKSI